MKKEPLVISRPLFYSICKIILIILFCIRIPFFLYLDFYLEMFDVYELPDISILFLIIIRIFISYWIFKYIYKCIRKTVLFLTDKKVYLKLYIPFITIESEIPLEKIAKVSSIDFFYIFRCIIIHQYNKIPFIFFTWNNKELKDIIIKTISNENDIIDSSYYKDKLFPETSFESINQISEYPELLNESINNTIINKEDVNGLDKLEEDIEKDESKKPIFEFIKKYKLLFIVIYALFVIIYSISGFKDGLSDSNYSFVVINIIILFLLIIFY